VFDCVFAFVFVCVFVRVCVSACVCFCVCVLRVLDIHMQKKVEPTSHHIQKLTQRWSKDRNACMLSHFSNVRLFATLWSVASQTPLSMEFSKQE